MIVCSRFRLILLALELKFIVKLCVCCVSSVAVIGSTDYIWHPVMLCLPFSGKLQCVKMTAAGFYKARHLINQ